MSIIKETGIILKEIETGETSKRLVLLTKNRGKVVVFARGVKGVKSKLHTNKLSYNEFVIYDGGQFLSLTQISAIEQFANITQNYDAFCVANFCLELTDKMMLANMDSVDAINLILLAFSRLNKVRDPNLIFAAFVFKFLQKEGLAPIANHCVTCQSTLNKENNCFGQEGFLCQNCIDNNEVIICNHEATAAIQYILNAEVSKVFNFKASPDVLQILQQSAILFLRHNVDVQLKSLEFF